MVGVIYIVLSSKKLVEDFLDVQTKMHEFPAFVRRYVGMFLWTDFAAECIQELISFIGIIMLMRVYCDRENFKRSSASLRSAWLVLTGGPFVVFIVVPIVFAFRSDILRRDLCAVTTGVFVRDQLTGTVFSQAANLAGEVQLATAASSGSAVLFGKPGYESAPLTQWCYSHSMDWTERLFSKPWVQSAVGSLGDGTTIQAPAFKTYPGVIPKAFDLIITSFGLPNTGDYAFCSDKKYTLSARELAGIKIGSLEQQAEIHDAGPTGLSSFLPEMFGLQRKFGPFASEKASQVHQEQLDRFASSKRHNSTRQTIAVTSQGVVVVASTPPLLRRMPREHHGRTPHARTQHAISVDFNEENAWKSLTQSHHAGDQIFDGALSEQAYPPLHARAQERLVAWHDLPEYPAYPAPRSLSQEAETRVDSRESASEDPAGATLAAKVGLNSICAAKKLAMAYAKVATFCHMSTKLMLGMYCAVANTLPMFSLVVGVIDGVGAGTTNVKMVLKKSSLPGYLMMLTVIVTLPAFMFILAFLSQLGGHPLFSGAMLFLTMGRVVDLWFAKAQIEEKSTKKLKEIQGQVGKMKKASQIFAGLFLVAFIAWKMYQTKMSVEFDSSAVQEMFIKQMKQVGAIGIMLTKFLFTRVSTKLITTNYVLQCVFDSANDSLSAQGEDADEVEKSFQKLMGKKPKKKQQHEDVAGPSEPGMEPASEPPTQEQIAEESAHQGKDHHDGKHHSSDGEALDGDEDGHKNKKKNKKLKKSKS